MTLRNEIDEYWRGYRDGRNPDAPEPGDNQHPRYTHSFRVGRAELAGKPIPAYISRRAVAKIEAKFVIPEEGPTDD